MNTPDEKARAERDAAKRDAKRLAHRLVEAEAERDELRTKHAALRADVDEERLDNSVTGGDRYAYATVVLRGILDRDAARDPQPDPERDDPTNERLCGPPHCMQREGHFMPCDWDDDSDSPTCDTVTLPRDVAEALTQRWTTTRPYSEENRRVTLTAREALGWSE